MGFLASFPAAHRLQQDHRAARLGQHIGVFLLVVVGDIGRGHDHGGLSDGGQLRQGGGPASAEDQVRRLHHRGHVVDIFPDLQVLGQSLPVQRLGHRGKIPACAVDVVEGSAVGGSQAEILRHVLVHPLGPQAAPIGQHQRPVVCDAQGRTGLLAVQLEKVAPDRGARHHHPLRVLVVGAGGLIAHHHAIRDFRQPLGGQARHSVGVMHRRGDAALGGLVDHGIGGVAAGPHHEVGLKVI